MKISRILSIIMAFLMGTTTINATEKEVNGQPYVQLNNGQWMPYSPPCGWATAI